MTSHALETQIRPRLEALTADAARAHGDDPATAGLLVALSGGPDSVALLAVACDWARDAGRPLHAAHFNHRLRNPGADQDEAFCRDLCAQFDVPLTVGSADPRPVARQRGRGLEEAARHLRLGFLEDTRAHLHLAAVATGHHRQDQAETVVMRLFRGTGPDGLRGIRPRHGRRVRPLLEVTRPQLLDLLAARGLAWRDDPTNDDASNVRGRVRRELLPLVRDIFGSGAAENPARLADLLETDLAFLETRADAAWHDLAGPALAGHTGRSLDVTGLVALPTALAGRVIRRWLQPHLPQDLVRRHAVDILAWLGRGQSGSGLDLPGPLRLARVFDRVGVAASPPPLEDATAWRVRIEPLTVIPDPPPVPERDGDAWRLICPAENLAGGLRVRNPRPGDRLEQFGLAGSKKLSDLMQEKRIPADLRPGVLVIEDARGLLWVVGIAQAERTRLLPTTGQAVTIILDRRRRDPGD